MRILHQLLTWAPGSRATALEHCTLKQQAWKHFAPLSACLWHVQRAHAPVLALCPALLKLSLTTAVP